MWTGDSFIMMKNISGSKKGYYTVEAALFLPLFILALLTVGYIIKVYGCNENVIHAAADESRDAASRAYNISIAPFFEEKLESRIMSENKDITWADVKRFRYLHEKDGLNGLISFDVDYRVDVKLPLKLKEGFDGKERVRSRGFIGYSARNGPMPFADMEKELDSRTVWVFPYSGIRYHKESCSHIASYPRQMIKNDNVTGSYSPCRLCHPENIRNGNLVYCFMTSGYAYHKGDCKMVDKYVISMEKYQAEERGYTPCLKCGGV